MFPPQSLQLLLLLLVFVVVAVDVAVGMPSYTRVPSSVKVQVRSGWHISLNTPWLHQGADGPPHTGYQWPAPLPSTWPDSRAPPTWIWAMVRRKWRTDQAVWNDPFLTQSPGARHSGTTRPLTMQFSHRCPSCPAPNFSATSRLWLWLWLWQWLWLWFVVFVVVVVVVGCWLLVFDELYSSKWIIVVGEADLSEKKNRQMSSVTCVFFTFIEIEQLTHHLKKTVRAPNGVFVVVGFRLEKSHFRCHRVVCCRKPWTSLMFSSTFYYNNNNNNNNNNTWNPSRISRLWQKLMDIFKDFERTRSSQ